MDLKESVEKLLREGAARLRARAERSYAVGDDALLERLRATAGKYLFRDNPDANPSEVDRFLDALRADDLLLALACEGGDENAWVDLMEGYRATVLSAARGASASEADAEELSQSVWAELYGLRARAKDGRPSGKLAYYSGCGSLGGWLRAVVGQLGVDRHRRTSRLVQTEEASDFDRLTETDGTNDDWRPADAPDPERALFETEAARAVEDALARSVSELEDEDRLLVKLYYVDGLRLKEAGAVLGVHEATASRRLSRAHAQIRNRVEAVLIEERGWTREETAATLSDVASQLQTDVSALIASGRGATKGEEAYE